MSNEIKVPIPSRVYNAATGGHVAGAEDIDFGQKVKHLVKYDHSGNEVSFASQLSAQNTIYVIHDDFTLTADVTIPSGCTLKFEGGSISGAYTITGQNTGIEAGLVQIFNTNVLFAGTWNVSEAYPEWFGAKGDGVTDDTIPLQKTIDFSRKVFISKKIYGITEPLIIRDTITIIGDHSEMTTPCGVITGQSPSIHQGYILALNEMDCIIAVNSLCVTIENIALNGDNKATDGFKNTSGVYKSRLTFKNCYVGNVIETAYNLISTYIVYGNMCIAYGFGKIGFLSRGGTTTTFENCYGKSSKEGAIAFTIWDTIYSTLISCAADHVEIAYNIASESEAVSLLSCGCEGVNIGVQVSGYNKHLNIDSLFIIPKQGGEVLRIGGQQGDIKISNLSIKGSEAYNLAYYVRNVKNVLNDLSPADEPTYIDVDHTVNKFGCIGCVLRENNENLIKSSSLKLYQYNADTFIWTSKANGMYTLTGGTSTALYLANLGSVILDPGTYFYSPFVKTYSNKIKTLLTVGNDEFNNEKLSTTTGGTFEIKTKSRVNFGIRISSNTTFSDTLIVPLLFKVSSIEQSPKFRGGKENHPTFAPNEQVGFMYQNDTHGTIEFWNGTKWMTSNGFHSCYRANYSAYRGTIINPNDGDYCLDASDKGYCFFDLSLQKPTWLTEVNGALKWVEADGAKAGVARSGTFASKPSASDIYVGFKYFCTDKQTTEGATDGIEIIHKGNDVWVDALGRVVS